MNKLNIKLLQKIKKKILEKPEHFDMNEFIKGKRCGTTCCIAGWGSVIYAREKHKRLNDSLEHTANILGLNFFDKGFHKVFYDCCWLQPYQNIFYSSKTSKQKAKVAAKYINYLCKHPEVLGCTK